MADQARTTDSEQIARYQLARYQYNDLTTYWGIYDRVRYRFLAYFIHSADPSDISAAAASMLADLNALGPGNREMKHSYGPYSVTMPSDGSITTLERAHIRAIRDDPSDLYPDRAEAPVSTLAEQDFALGSYLDPRGYIWFGIWNRSDRTFAAYTSPTADLDEQIGALQTMLSNLSSVRAGGRFQSDIHPYRHIYVEVNPHNITLQTEAQFQSLVDGLIEQRNQIVVANGETMPVTGDEPLPWAELGEEQKDERWSALWAALHEEAEKRGWCSDYDRFAKRFGVPAKTYDGEVTLRLPNVPLPGTWEALSEAEKREVLLAAVIDGASVQITGYDMRRRRR